MATYKVLQDIEAEDKLLGPLTLKQFIFAIITLLLGFLGYVFAQINILLAIPWIAPVLFFGFMATPINKDQPNDVWLAARLRFLIQPRKRIWDQTGMKDLVIITAPKKLEVTRTDGLSQDEVKSRLSALGKLMDTRGWAVKNNDSFTSTEYLVNPGYKSTERLFRIDNNQLQEEFEIGIKPSDDILNISSNSIAQRIDSTIKKQRADKMEQLKNSMHNIAEKSKTYNTSTITDQEIYGLDESTQAGSSVNSEPGYVNFGSKVINPHDNNVDESSKDNYTYTDEDQNILEKIHKSKEIHKKIESASHGHRIEPLNNPSNETKEAIKDTNRTKSNAIIKELSQANDISVASIAKLAEHAEKEATLKDDEVISLH